MNACTVRQRRGSVKGSVYINCSSRQTEKMLSVHGASAKQKQKARTVTIEVWENMSEMKCEIERVRRTYPYDGARWVER